MKFSALLCGLLAATLCVSQQIPKPKTQAGKRPATEPATLVPFNSSQDVLPAHFQGTNVRDLWSLLDKQHSNEVKSEYEAEQAYQTRIDGIRAELLTKTLHRNDLMAFVLPTEASIYDAEKQELHLPIPFSQVRSWNENAPTWGWDKTYAKGQSYVGSNSFGASTRVSSGTSTEYNIVAPFSDWFYKQLPPNGYTYTKTYNNRSVVLSMGPEDAKRSRSLLKFILVGTLSSPSINTAVRYSPATMDSPLDLITRSRNIHLDVQQVWVFDEATGRIIKKYSNE